MKRMILSLMALVMMIGSASAQRLVSVKNYGANWDRTLITLKNKPNGTIYRLREEIQNEYLPRVPEAKGLEMFISERIGLGWLAMYRLPAGDQNYKFIVVISTCCLTWLAPAIPAVSTARDRSCIATIPNVARWCGRPTGSPATTSLYLTPITCSAPMVSPARRNSSLCSTN